MKTFKQFTGNPVTKLKTAMVQKKDTIKTASKKQAYDKIDKIMTTISKQHDITGKELHDMWVKKHGVIPDEWIKKQ